MEIPKRTVAEIFFNRVFDIAKYPNLMDIHENLLRWCITFLIKNF